MNERFNYLTPIILPILPRVAGLTMVGLNLDQLVPEVAGDDGDARLTIEVRVFSEGELVSRDTSEVVIVSGKPEPMIFQKYFDLNELGYAEISIVADRPYFRIILTEAAFALVERPDHGSFNVHGSFKFSDPGVVSMMRDIGELCLVHPSQYVSKADDIGNSVLIVNPFDGPIVARISAPKGREVRKRVMPRQMEIVPLTELLNDNEWSCVLYTGNNRYPAWDIRHAYFDRWRINRLDHLEIYRGSLTLQRLSLANFVKSRARRTLRTLGLRNN